MANYISVPITGISKDPRPMNTKTYALDFKNCLMTSRKIDGIEAVNQYITKALMTPRFKCLIYSSAYGSGIKQLISTSPSRKYLEASLSHIVEDAIIHDSRITAMNNDFSFTFDGDEMNISFSVKTIY